MTTGRPSGSLTAGSRSICTPWGPTAPYTPGWFSEARVGQMTLTWHDPAGVDGVDSLGNTGGDHAAVLTDLDHGQQLDFTVRYDSWPARLAQELAFLYEGHIGTALQAFRNDTFKAALGLAKELCSYAAQNDTYRTLVLVTKYERDRESFLALLWQLDQLCSAVLRRPAYGAEQCGGLTPDRAARILQVSAATRKTVTGNGNLRLAVAVFAAEAAR